MYAPALPPAISLRLVQVTLLGIVNVLPATATITCRVTSVYRLFDAVPGHVAVSDIVALPGIDTDWKCPLDQSNSNEPPASGAVIVFGVCTVPIICA